MNTRHHARQFCILLFNYTIDNSQLIPYNAPTNPGGYHVTDLLLITDVPRLRKIFSRLSETKDIHLRIVNNLEKGAEELAAEKPGIVFVQTHLSGLSAEIILMHLKKQLGRKRTRFVLLSTPDQASSEALRLYQGLIDTSLDDGNLLISIKDIIAALLTKTSKKVDAEPTPAESVPDEQQPPQTTMPVENMPAIILPTQETDTQQLYQPEEQSLVDQGITYAPRSRMSVYSEFNSSFDTAVSSMKPAATLDEATPEQSHDWNNDEIETIDPSSSRSKRAVFLLWLAPVVIAVIVVTLIQNRRSPPPSPELSQKAATSSIIPARTDLAAAQKQRPYSSATPLQIQKPATPKASTESNPALSDKAVLSAIAENRGSSVKTVNNTVNGRLSELPDFIPRSALDKTYTSANPGWERYKGQVTEFKVFREGTSIKAIQVIDRGGNGVPESFMRAALRQVSKNPTFVMESSEKKEGYEIQRGHTAENLKVMYYRDDQGGKLRAFVLTWQ
jgi:hypothetical protein